MMPEIEMDWWRKLGEMRGRETKNLDLNVENLDVTIEPVTGTVKWLKTELADFVTHTSSSANVVIDSASAELTKRITKQIGEIERARAEGRPLPNTLE
jgi:hypothetical protein